MPSRRTLYNIQDLTDKIVNELNKCIVLCRNCHIVEHSDIEFFEKYKKYIIDKSINLKEIQPKIDRNKVKEMYMYGMKQSEICNSLNASKGTISDIIKELRLKDKTIVR